MARLLCFCCGCQTCSHYSKGGASCILSFSLSPAPLVVFFFAEATRENGRAGGPSISAAKLPMAGLRRQTATGVENFYPQFSAPVAGNLPSAQTMTAAPTGAVALSGGCRSSRNPPRRAHDAAGIPPPVLQVVSKCALREKKRKAPGFPETSQRTQSCCGSFCIR